VGQADVDLPVPVRQGKFLGRHQSDEEGVRDDDVHAPERTGGLYDRFPVELRGYVATNERHRSPGLLGEASAGVRLYVGDHDRSTISRQTPNGRCADTVGTTGDDRHFP